MPINLLAERRSCVEHREMDFFPGRLHLNTHTHRFMSEYSAGDEMIPGHLNALNITSLVMSGKKHSCSSEPFSCWASACKAPARRRVGGGGVWWACFTLTEMLNKPLKAISLGIINVPQVHIQILVVKIFCHITTKKIVTDPASILSDPSSLLCSSVGCVEQPADKKRMSRGCLFSFLCVFFLHLGLAVTGSKQSELKTLL